MTRINQITTNNYLSGTLFAFIIIDKKYRQFMLLAQYCFVDWRDKIKLMRLLYANIKRT